MLLDPERKTSAEGADLFAGSEEECGDSGQEKGQHRKGKLTIAA
jgi:hypothetical protein